MPKQNSYLFLAYPRKNPKFVKACFIKPAPDDDLTTLMEEFKQHTDAAVVDCIYRSDLYPVPNSRDIVYTEDYNTRDGLAILLLVEATVSNKEVKQAKATLKGLYDIANMDTIRVYIDKHWQPKSSPSSTYTLPHLSSDLYMRRMDLAS